ncbi:CG12507 [Drosophila busckii]|uniref:CG12507 n=1 Tax=Drosophila busckii TaxID=30019 RepID=A0A0M5J6H5_DROBS|nr:uncharacterized protein LOC108606013 [Drosophila busckii]ALC49961.1 CG12507 [Drosophila busckii]
MINGKSLLLTASLLILASTVQADGSFDLNLKQVDDIIDVDSADALEPALGQHKQPHAAGYADYDYYMNARRLQEANAGDNELSASSPMRVPNRESSPHRYRRPDELPAKSSSWYGPYANKPLAMYPSRSYDPYIRRYDRFDEQYHRAYPQYFEDMYVHRQRFDPYDSYSPRVPQYPDPYLMYPDRQLDTPPVRDYIKSRRGYQDEPMLDSYSNKYAPTKLPAHPLATRNERVVYYAHLPEIVRTPYDLSLTRKDRNAAAAALTAQAPYKLSKKKIKSAPRVNADNSTSYKPAF